MSEEIFVNPLKKVLSFEEKVPSSPPPTINRKDTNIYLSRLIDAGASGLADFLVGKVIKQYKRASRKNDTTVNGEISDTDEISFSDSTTTDTTTLDARTRHLNHITTELQPISWHHWITNVILICRYINEEGGTLFLGGLDLTRLSHKLLDLVCCGKRRRERILPTYQRLHHSFVIWDATKRRLRGTDGTNGEFGFIKQSILVYGAIYFTIMILLVITTFAFQNTYMYGISPYAPSIKLDVISAIYSGYSGILILCVITLGYIAVMIVAGPTLVGSREGSLPTLMPYLLQASAPEFFISYSWNGGMASLARALGEILPHSWIDVRSLVSGQTVERETVTSAARSRVTILLLTPEYLRSRNCAGELYAAVTQRRHKGPGKWHKTIALIENHLLQESKSLHSPIDVDLEGDSTRKNARNHTSVNSTTEKKHIEEARLLLERKGYTVVQNEPDIHWNTIKNIFEESGIQVVTSVEMLLSTIQNTTLRTQDEDTAICMRWWAKYPAGVSTITSQNTRLRIPWNLANQSNHKKVRKLPQPFCTFLFRLFCFRRPYKQQGVTSWKEKSITTGMGGAWISFDGVNEPVPHVDITLRAFLDIIAISAVFIVFVILSVVIYSDFKTPDDTDEHLSVFRSVLSSIGAGTICTFCFAFVFMVGIWTLINELFPSNLILHSSVLFPFFALAEIQNVPTLLNSADHPSSDDVDGATDSGSDTNDTLSKQPRSVTVNVEGNNTPRALSFPRTNNRRQRTKHTFSIIFAHNNSQIQTSIHNMNKFLATYVFGMDEDPTNPQYPKVESLSDVLQNPEHPKPFTVYVFFLDTEEARQAWSDNGKRIDNPWRPEYVVLVTDATSLRNGTDLVSAKYILTNILPLTITMNKDNEGTTVRTELAPNGNRAINMVASLTSSTVISNASSSSSLDQIPSSSPECPTVTVYDNRTSIAADILRIFEQLDHGKKVCINEYTVPSSPATREALHQLLRRLGYKEIPYGTDIAYQSPYTIHNLTATPPLLLSVLGPLVAYGSGNILAKRKMLELQDHTTIGTSSNAHTRRGVHNNPTRSPMIQRTNSNDSSTVMASRTEDELEEVLTPRSVSLTIPSSPSAMDASMGMTTGNTYNPSSIGHTYGAVTDSTSILLHPENTDTSSRPIPVVPRTRNKGTIRTYETTSDRMQDHMLIVYTLPDRMISSDGRNGNVQDKNRPIMPEGSPYEGLVPAVLEAIALKLGPVIILSGGF